jgi:disulfide bond formation protein DsbB
MSYRVLATSRSRFGLGFEDVGRTIAILSALALAGALALEHIGGVLPCPLCLDQRIAYYAAVPLGLLAFAMAAGRPQWSRLILAIIAIGFVINAGLGVFHAGVEWGWWPGPDTCSGIGSIATSPDALLKSFSKPQVVRCDQAAIRIFGLSLAGYSAILSAGLAILAARGALRG